MSFYAVRKEDDDVFVHVFCDTKQRNAFILVNEGSWPVANNLQADFFVILGAKKIFTSCDE